MPVTVILAAFTVAVAVPILWWSLARSRLGAKTVDRSVLAGPAGPVDLRSAVLQHSAGERAVAPTIVALSRALRRLTPYGWVEALERRITRAGRPAAWPIERVLVAKFVVGALAFGAGFLLFVDEQGLAWLLLWVALTALGYTTPDLLLFSHAQKRQQAIDKALPDTLDQMTVSVEAGLGFEAAMARAGRTGHGPLADELVRTLQEVQVGVPRSKALRDLAGRAESVELKHFVLAVVQAEQYGIPIADVLRTQASEQRVKRRQRAEEHAMKIPVKIVFPLVLCIFPTIFIIILGPAVIQLVRMFGERL